MVSIFRMTMTGHRWSRPELLPFASSHGDIDVTISPDGRKLLFSSRRPLPGGSQPRPDNDFWMAERSGTEWQDPVHLGSGINSDSEDYYPMMSAAGAIYFSSRREGPGTNNIYISRQVNGVYGDVVKMGPAVNTQYREFDPYVSRDESMLIFASNRPGGHGASDLYISFRGADGNWIPAVNMGDTINSPGSEYSPMISPDCNYLFFTASRRQLPRVTDGPAAYDDFMAVHNGPGYLFSDIYWVDAGIIDRLRR